MEVNNNHNVSDEDIMAQLIKKGLRAQLQTGSLLTGQLLVDLDFHPKSQIVLSDNKSVYPEFPTTDRSLDQITHSANIIMDKIAKLPLEDLTAEANKTLQSLQGTTKAATSMLGIADKTMNSAHHVLSELEPGSNTHYELEQLLQELTQAASSVKQLTDYLEQNPDALLRGKKEE